MTTQSKTPSRGELLKQLRIKHAKSVEHTQALFKEQKHMQQVLCAFLRERPRTVPEAAEATGIPADKVLWFLSAMKKYGIVVEAGMCGDYPRYSYQNAEEH